MPIDRLNRREWGLLLILIACTLAIVAVHPDPPMNDASSHIATAHIFWKLQQGDPFLAAHYRFLPIPLPYWGTTLAMFPLLHLFGPLMAFKVLVLAYAVLVPVAFYLLQRTLLGAASPLLLVAALTVFNWAYWLGESNFLFSQPLLLLAFALYAGLTRVRSLAFAGFAALAAIIYLFHIYSLTGLLIALCAFSAPRLLSPLRRRTGAAPLSPAQWLALCLCGALFLLACYFVMFQHGTAANRGSIALNLSPRKLAYTVIHPFDWPAGPSRALILLFVGAVVLLPLWGRAGALRRSLRQGLADLFHLPLLLPALALLGVCFLGPDAILNPDGSIKEDEISVRFALGGTWFLLAALRPAAARTGRVLLLLAVVLFGGGKLENAMRHHAAQGRRLAEVRGLLSRIPPHQRLLPLMDRPGATQAEYLHHRAGNYVVFERAGYCPHVFAVTGQQALRHVRWGDYRRVEDLKVRPEEWAFYDYVLVQTERPRPAVPGLAERAAFVASGGGFQLYQIRR